jgi:hypothetical protein
MNVKPSLCLALLTVCAPLAHSEVCNPADLQGAYGFLLTGEAAIGAGPQPIATLGSLTFDGSGQISGTSSVKFTGLLLGNPVTGTYMAQEDCSVSWSLQDDSGGFQHFQGTMSSDGRRISFRQTDPGGARNGTMVRTAGACNSNSLSGRYNLSVSGSNIDVQTARNTGSISVKGFLDADGAGGVAFSSGSGLPPVSAGTYKFEDGCALHIVLKLPVGGDQTADMDFRGILADSGTAAFAIQTDPGGAVSLRLTR